MKYLFTILLSVIVSISNVVLSENYDSYAEECQEVFYYIDSLINDPDALKKYRLTQSVLESIKEKAILEISNHPKDEDMVCAMVGPALQLLVAARNPSKEGSNNAEEEAPLLEE